MSGRYSTVKVAKLVGITSDTLHRWIREKRFKAPPIQSLAGMKVRLWNESDIAKVKNYKAEQYRKKPNREKRKLTT